MPWTHALCPDGQTKLNHNNHLVTFNNITMPVSHWAKAVGMPAPRLYARLKSSKQPLARILDPTPLKRPDMAGNIHNTGYIRLRKQGKHVHRIYAEAILGKPLPPKAVVHHVNGNKLQHHNNLVICEDRAYHSLLHIRQNAYQSCGNASWRKCKFCKRYDDPTKLSICKDGHTIYHKSCQNLASAARRDKRLCHGQK